MAIAYHIDRLESLHEGDILNLKPITSNGLGKKQMNIRGFYEVSQFSQQLVDYYDNLFNEDYINSYQQSNSIEMDSILEGYRYLINSDLPSRLQCFYACDSLEEISKWISFLDIHHYKVWKIEYDTQAVKFDANLLRCDALDDRDPSMLLEYWKQGVSDNPLYELLIPFPIKIIEDVTQSVEIH